MLSDLQITMSKGGTKSEMMDGDELWKKFPYIRSKHLIGASYSESGLLIDPRNYLSTLIKLFKKKGGTVYRGNVTDLISIVLT